MRSITNWMKPFHFPLLTRGQWNSQYWLIAGVALMLKDTICYIFKDIAALQYICTWSYMYFCGIQRCLAEWTHEHGLRVESQRREENWVNFWLLYEEYCGIPLISSMLYYIWADNPGAVAACRQSYERLACFVNTWVEIWHSISLLLWEILFEEA